MDDIVKFLKGFSIQVIIEIAVVGYILMAPIRADIAKHDERFAKMDERFIQYEQRLDQLYTTLIQMLDKKNK